jgi:hypothetical protein
MDAEPIQSTDVDELVNQLAMNGSPLHVFVQPPQL